MLNKLGSTSETPNPISRPLDAFFDAPGPDLEIVSRAREVLEIVRKHAQEGEDNRCVSEEVVNALHERGLFHISVPKRLGGSGANFRTFIDAVAEVAKADGGTAWAMALLNVCTWFASLYSDQAQEESFGTTPGARICGIFTAPAKTEIVEGGIRVTGEWWYASGSRHAQWATLGVSLGTNPDGSTILGLALVPFSDLTYRDTWFVAGMRASGSNTLVADNVFIPSHRIQNFGDMANEAYARSDSDEPNDYASFVPVAEIVLVAAQLGLARGAIDLTLSKAPTKSVAYTTFTQARHSPVHQIELAEAVSLADQAYLLVARACADIDSAALRKEKLDPLTRARIRMDTGQAGKLAREAINKLLSVNGASSFALSNSLQRIWRDSEVASRHAFVLPEMANLIYGRVLFGVEEIVQPF
ncbi:acyl-CoA dehydrogenase family protein [Rhizobium sp. KVB221]|uniref:Acyl-CoA dehydrogenase family protein n=1 Tax=Rhizobium setariae TaxID=2801340 RepID=A0A936YS74_9HYPH|nr:acyl-CoA dehydrogenase family protein [Rhizobium setariae]MBL0371896.1 acyl-CoA dehydrogenase family protein [Rhizobium setariae]